MRVELRAEGTEDVADEGDEPRVGPGRLPRVPGVPSTISVVPLTGLNRW